MDMGEEARGQTGTSELTGMLSFFFSFPLSRSGLFLTIEGIVAGRVGYDFANIEEGEGTCAAGVSVRGSDIALKRSVNAHLMNGQQDAACACAILAKFTPKKEGKGGGADCKGLPSMASPRRQGQAQSSSLGKLARVTTQVPSASGAVCMDSPPSSQTLTRAPHTASRPHTQHHAC